MNADERANRITELHKLIGIKTGILENLVLETAEGQKLKDEISELLAELKILQDTKEES